MRFTDGGKTFNTRGIGKLVVSPVVGHQRRRNRKLSPLTSLGVMLPEWLDGDGSLNTRPPTTDRRGFITHRAMTISRAVFTSSHDMVMALSEETAAVQVSKRTHQPGRTLPASTETTNLLEVSTFGMPGATMSESDGAPSWERSMLEQSFTLGVPKPASHW